MGQLIYSKEYPRGDMGVLESEIDELLQQKIILPDFAALSRQMESSYVPDLQRVQEADGFIALAKELAENCQIDIQIYRESFSFSVSLLFDHGTDLTPLRPLLNMADEFGIYTMLEDSRREMVMIIEYRMYVRQT